MQKAYILPGIFLVCTAVVIMYPGCREHENEEENNPSELIVTDSLVTNLPVFDGATCLVCIDIPRIAGDTNTNWAVAARNNAGLPDFNSSMVTEALMKEINEEIAKCPPGSNIKLQLMYHCSGKPYFHRSSKDGKIRQDTTLSLSEFVDSVLTRMAATPIPRIKKIYLTACNSDNLTTNVKNAMKVPGIGEVVTVNHTILLTCGYIMGSGYPVQTPDTVRVFVYQRSGKKFYKFIPDHPVPVDSAFDIGTNTTTKRPF